MAYLSPAVAYLNDWVARIQSGQSTFDDFRWTVNIYANQDPYADPDYRKRTEADSQHAQAGADLIYQRLNAIARNRGVAPGALAVASRPGGAMTDPATNQPVTKQPQAREGTTYNPSVAPTPNEFQKDPATRTAEGLLRSTLIQYGFSPDEVNELVNWAMGLITAGAGAEEILLDMRQHRIFKAHFPEIEERQRRGLAPIGPGEIISYRQKARQLFRGYGLPEGFYDSPDDFRKMIVNDWSLDEVNKWLQFGIVQMGNASREEKEIMNEMYGLGASPGEVLSFFLDEERSLPVLERQFAAAGVGAAARQSGFGRLTRQEQEDLAEFGIRREGALTGFESLAQRRELFDPLPGFQFAEDQIAREEQFGATFKGNANARRRIRRRERERQAQFEGGGSFVAGRGGIAGLGTAED